MDLAPALPPADPTALPAGDEAPPAGVHVPAVVVGWVQAGPLDEVGYKALKKARTLVRKRLHTALPGFAWASPLVRRPDLVRAGRRAEPVDLLDAGAAERDLGGWDFALVVTAADLRPRFRPFVLATPSQALAVGVVSMARLDPGLRSSAVPATDRVDAVARRLAALALHTLGHLNGLSHQDDPAAFMHPPRTPADLDAMTSFVVPSRDELEAELADVADPRTEESQRFRRLGTVAFVVQTLWRAKSDVVGAVVQIRPWRFPFQLSRLTTAAVSLLVIFLITAEAWDLGMRQPPALVAALSLAALVGTSGYLVRKQRLLAHRHGRVRSEQAVVTAASILIAIGVGMAATYALLFGTTVAVGALLFDADLLTAWAATLGEPVGPGHVATFAGFVAALGLGVGALGASFEEQTYFRHVAYVDEET